MDFLTILTVLAGIFVFFFIAFLVENRFAWLFSWAIFLSIIVSALFGQFNIFTYVFYNFNFIIGYVILYFSAGFLYSFFKWWRFLVNKKEYVVDRANCHYPRQDQEEARKKYLKEHMPLATDHLDRIAAWTVYWPWSLVWTLMSDILFRIGQKIWDGIVAVLNYISGIYNRITEYVWNKI